MDICFKCERSAEEVRLLDAISNNEIVKICEECVLGENIPVIRRPTTSQLKESERGYSVYERLKKMAGIRDKERTEIEKMAKNLTQPRIDDLKKLKERKEEFEKKFQIRKPLSLIDNFNWHVYMARKKKKLDRKQLADLIGESESAINMIENKQLPEDALVLVNKLEQFFGIKLRKYVEEERREERPELMATKKAEGVGEIVIEVEEEKHEKKQERKPTAILKFDKEAVKNLTISDLKRMKEAREQKERLERMKQLKADDLIWQVDKEEKEREKKEWEEKAEQGLVGDDVEVVD